MNEASTHQFLSSTKIKSSHRIKKKNFERLSENKKLVQSKFERKREESKTLQIEARDSEELQKPVPPPSDSAKPTQKSRYDAAHGMA